MNREETSKVLSYVKAAYPANFKDMSRDDMKRMLSIWERKFKEIPAEFVLTAVDNIISKSKYAPSIVEVSEALADLYWDFFEERAAARTYPTLYTEERVKWLDRACLALQGIAKQESKTFELCADAIKMIGERK